MISRMPIEAVVPAKLPISVRIISPMERPVPADGEGQDQEILHGAGEDDAGQYPQRAGKVAHLGSENGADQRAGAGDGGEMVAEEETILLVGT